VAAGLPQGGGEPCPDCRHFSGKLGGEALPTFVGEVLRQMAQHGAAACTADELLVMSRPRLEHNGHTVAI
jgi:hypothetical protein